MKKIYLSILAIIATVALVGGATYALFTDTTVRGSNTFAMGTVDLNTTWTSGFPFSFVNLTPGAESVSGVLGIGYGGSIPADLYFGLRAAGGSDLKDVLDYYIEEVKANGNHIRNVFGWRGAVDAFANWNKVADNLVEGNWRYYKIHVRVHDIAGNTYQGLSAMNDVIFYAVQDGQVPPASPAPYEFQ